MKLLSDYALLNNLEGAEDKTIVIFPGAIYGFEICSVTLKNRIWADGRCLEV
jgi:hypothetical protein